MRHLGYLLVALAAVGCSLGNREGPDVSCADLDDGAVNACQEGIIARCDRGAVAWKVCEDEAICDEAWQTPEAYQCAFLDPPPQLTGGGNPAGGNGSGGSIGVGGVGGNTATGGIQGSTGGFEQPAEACGLDDVCIVTMLPTLRGAINQLVIANGSLYVAAECEGVWSIPLEGGFTTQHQGSSGNCTFDALAVDATHVYYPVHAGTVRVAIDGGAMEMISTIRADSIAIDSTAVYFGERNFIKRYDKASGAVTTISEDYSGPPLRIDNDNLYWSSGDAIHRLAKTAGVGDGASDIALGGPTADDLVVLDGFIYFGDITGGTVTRIDASSAAVTNLAAGLVGTVSDPGPERLAANSTHVYWTRAASVEKTAKDGSGVLETIGTWEPASTGDRPIVADERFVFWAEGDVVKRAPR